jgi:hypothetical protein
MNWSTAGFKSAASYSLPYYAIPYLSVFTCVCLLSHVDPLLGSDRGRNNYTTAVAK